MPRKRTEPVEPEAAKVIGSLLRGLRREAGFRAVRDAAARPECPAALQTIYAYERGGLVPSLPQFMDLVEFYALKTDDAPEPERLRFRAVAAMTRALTLPAYHVAQALELIERLQPQAARGRSRSKSA